MKELSIEEKAKRYDEALKAAIVAHKDEDKHLKATLERIFPELKESEGERIRKWLIELVEEVRKANPTNVDYNGMCGEAIVWLEKQREQKPAWSEEDESNLDSAIYYIRREPYCESDVEPIVDWLRHLKGRVQPQPKQEWSEEDENRINRLINYFEDKESFTDEDDIVYANWLKSLRPQNTWKPSDEQMRELGIVATGKGWFSKEILSELLEQLKKLREE